MNKLLLRIQALFKGAQRSTNAVPPPVQSPAEDVEVTVLIYGIYFTMTVFLAAALYVAFAVFIPGVTPPDTSCKGNREGECGEGKVCREGACVEEPILPACAAGGSCEGCVCLQPNRCDSAQVCQPPAQAVATCDKETSDFVKELLDYQTQCISNAGGETLSSCPADKVENFLLSHAGFDRLLKGFPSGLIFLFPANAPPTNVVEGEEGRGDQWPDEVTRKRYLDEARRLTKELKAAKHIVLVGRASQQGGTTQQNFAFAGARVRFARQILLDALAETRVERDETATKFIEFALGADRPLQFEFFQTYSYPAVTWSSQSVQDLSKALGKLGQNQPLARDERSKMNTLINRSVVIFVIPPECSRGS